MSNPTRVCINNIDSDSDDNSDDCSIGSKTCHLKNNDIIMGRGAPAVHHKGNINFRKLVESRMDDYINAGTNHIAKTNIALSVIAQIHANHGRFLCRQKKNDTTSTRTKGRSNQNYILVPIADEKFVIEKTKQVFRDFAKRVKLRLSKKKLKEKKHQHDSTSGDNNTNNNDDGIGNNTVTTMYVNSEDVSNKLFELTIQYAAQKLNKHHSTRDTVQQKVTTTKIRRRPSKAPGPAVRDTTTSTSKTTGSISNNNHQQKQEGQKPLSIFEKSTIAATRKLDDTDLSRNNHNMHSNSNTYYYDPYRHLAQLATVATAQAQQAAGATGFSDYEETTNAGDDQPSASNHDCRSQQQRDMKVAYLNRNNLSDHHNNPNDYPAGQYSYTSSSLSNVHDDNKNSAINDLQQRLNKPKFRAVASGEELLLHDSNKKKKNKSLVQPQCNVSNDNAQQHDVA